MFARRLRLAVPKPLRRGDCLSGGLPPGPFGGGPPRPGTKERTCMHRTNWSSSLRNERSPTCSHNGTVKEPYRFCARNHSFDQSWSSARAASCCLAQPLKDSWTSAPACSYLYSTMYYRLLQKFFRLGNAAKELTFATKRLRSQHGQAFLTLQTAVHHVQGNRNPFSKHDLQSSACIYKSVQSKA